MSPNSAVGAIVVGTFPLSAGQWFPEHQHPTHQLNWAWRGVLGVAVGNANWVLPPTRAMFIPAGVRHRTGATKDAVLRSLYLDPQRCQVDWPEPTPVAMDGLLANLIGYLQRADLDLDARRRAEAVLVDVLQPLPATPITVPDLVDERAMAVAELLRANPADLRSLEDFAKLVGAARRTLSRLFVADTGLSFDAWRTRLRLRAALPMLAEGHPVARVAMQVGYSTPSAFLAAFRRVVGTTPQRYLNGRAS